VELVVRASQQKPDADVRFGSNSTGRYASGGRGMSASPQKRPNIRAAAKRRFVPKADLRTAANSIFIQPRRRQSVETRG